MIWKNDADNVRWVYVLSIIEAMLTTLKIVCVHRSHFCLPPVIFFIVHSPILWSRRATVVGAICTIKRASWMIFAQHLIRFHNLTKLLCTFFFAGDFGCVRVILTISIEVNIWRCLWLDHVLNFLCDFDRTFFDNSTNDSRMSCFVQFSFKLSTS